MRPKMYYVVNARMPTEKAHGIQIAKMCEAFVSAGAEVVLVVPKRRNQNAQDVFAAYGIVKKFEIVYLPTIELPMGLPGAFALQTLSFAYSARRWLAQKKEKAVVYTRGEMILFLSSLPKHFALVWETHIKPDNVKRYAKGVQRAAGLVVVTRHFAEEIPSLWPVSKEKVFYAPDGVSLEAFTSLPSRVEARAKLALPQDKKIVVYTGSDVVWKGLEVLRVASDLLPDDYLVAFVGPIIEKGASSPGRLFAGIQPHAEMPLWCAAADVLVLTGSSQSNIANYYTSPLKLFEYMASGTPVVAADLPAFRDVISERNAFLFESNPEACARAVRLACESKDEALAHAAQARRDVQAFSWHKRAEAILLFIRTRL